MKKVVHCYGALYFKAPPIRPVCVSRIIRNGFFK